ncbi:MAG: PilZ domain-containing protein [Lachnospiraceae bacterium]|nr:PilZ domain-containing protein [Lachnospiraceae bacterium]
MYINEISGGATVKLEAVIGETMLEFETKAVAVDDKRQIRALESISKKLPYVLVEAIRQNDKVIGFPEKGAQYVVTYMDLKTKKPFQWQEVVVKQVAFSSGEKYHVFISAKNMKEINRRESFRLWMGCEGFLQDGLNNKFFPAIIKDLSANGIGFIVYDKHLEEASFPPKVSSTVLLVFNDESTGTQFKVAATVVRIEEMDGGRKLYGARFPQENARISKYVADKQRERNKTGGGGPRTEG